MEKKTQAKKPEKSADSQNTDQAEIMPKINLQKPAGTRDFLPEEMIKRKYLSEIIRTHFESFGFQEVLIPTFEFFKLYEIRSGEKIINDIFTFMDPPKHRDEKDPVLYALRPEFTAPICRFYISDKPSHMPKPLKFYYIGTCFRYDEPTPGRYREFWQAGCELFGASGIEADIEIYVLCLSLMNKLGIKDYLLRINDLSILRAFLTELSLKDETQTKAFGYIDKYSSLLRKVEIGAIEKVHYEEFIADFQKDCRSIQLDEPIIDILTDFLELVGSDETVFSRLTKSLENYPKTLEAIQNSPIKAIYQRLKILGLSDFCVIDCGIARGLDYYTGPVFEIDVKLLGKEKQVCGGGRYDKLISEFGGESVPATGFAFGFDRLLIAMERSGIEIPVGPRAELFIASMQGCEAIGMVLAKQLRERGLKVETDLMGRNFKNAAKFVNSLNIPYMIFIGPKEKESGLYTIKNFLTQQQFENQTVDSIFKIIQEKK